MSEDLKAQNSSLSQFAGQTSTDDLPPDPLAAGVCDVAVPDTMEMAQEHHLAVVRRYLAEQHLEATESNIAQALKILQSDLSEDDVAHIRQQSQQLDREPRPCHVRGNFSARLASLPAEQSYRRGLRDAFTGVRASASAPGFSPACNVRDICLPRRKPLPEGPQTG